MSMLIVYRNVRSDHPKNTILGGLFFHTSFVWVPQNLYEHFLPSNMKMVKTVIFLDFGSLVLASSKIYASPYPKMGKTLVRRFAQ